MKLWIIIAAINGFLAVALGAFGAHALRPRLEAIGRVDTWNTAVLYHLVHALALLAVGWLASHHTGWASTAAGICFTAGIVVFSGSLYVLCMTGVTKLGAITPIGGVAFLAGWVLVAVVGFRLRAG